MDETAKAGLYTLIGMIVTGIGTFILQYSKTKSSIKRDENADAFSRMGTFVDELQVQIKDLREQVSEIRKSERECLQRDADRAVALAEAKGQIEALRNELRRVQVITGDEYPASTFPVFLVITQDLKVKFSSPQVSGLLHYLPDNSDQGIIGKDVESLLPEEHRGIFREKAQQLIEGKFKLEPGNSWQGTLLTGDGASVDCIVHLTAFPSPAGSWIFTAEIRKAPNAADLAASGASPRVHYQRRPVK